MTAHITKRDYMGILAMFDESGPCAFCGHPDARHRVADAVVERVKAGEPIDEVAHDYGLDPQRLAAAFGESR